MRKSFLYSSFSLLALTACDNKDSLIIEDFESGSFENWTMEGDAFGETPEKGALPGQQPLVGFEGKFLANSFHNGDDSRGTLTSKPFRIERDYINFLIGGGMSQYTYIELLVNGQSVHKTHNLIESETLQLMSWDVKAYKDQEAILRIVDNQRGS